MKVSVPAPTRRLLEPVAESARARGLAVYAVGGCVRDWILGRATKDLDLAVDGDPSALAELAAERHRAKPESFGRFGTWRLTAAGFRMDFARCRTEVYPEPAALPVVAPAPLREDLFRRDFTINAMAVALEGKSELIDPHGGLRDLERRVIRVLHPLSFRDDPTRVFRAARFLARFGFKPASGLVAGAKEALAAGWAARLSRHRLAQELLRALEEADPSPALRLLTRWGYLDLLRPGLRLPARWPKGVYERLGALALGAKAGVEFLESLQLERKMVAPLHEALGVAAARTSPRSPLSPVALAILKHACPRLPRAALSSLFLTSDDLAKTGIAPGPEFGTILERAARLQWAGKLRDRRAALAWLADIALPVGKT